MHPEILIALTGTGSPSYAAPVTVLADTGPADRPGSTGRERVGWLLVEVGPRIVARRGERPAPPRVTAV